MSRKINLKVGDTMFTAELNDSNTARSIWEALPIRGQGNLWGKEIYFAIGMDMTPENARADFEPGELAYWPPGKAFCIFWGPTPASTGDRPRAASPCNPVGKIIGDISALDSVGSTDVIIERAEG
ncbi:MAG: hypothetical protein JRG73_12665 [Deltaproteobacteria bacterium]|nr:hypothetical protein [Deltaproteobacteria bacterium]MBW2307772.1 hypothetical protein [Deltaproteobacteria bacterium]